MVNGVFSLLDLSGCVPPPIVEDGTGNLRPF
jgi:hypothetical protein